MDLPGEKLVIKMWETIAEKGIGSALKPWHEKRLGKARNAVRKDEILMLAEAEKLANDIKSGKQPFLNVSEPLLQSSVNKSGERIEPTITLPDLAKTAASIDMSESIRKEVNVSKAVLVAENVLKTDEQEVPEEKVDDDWLFSWRDNAGKVSSSELQDLWGRILAGEVKSPGSYSFRTMEFIKGLSKTEAEIISNVAKFVVSEAIFRDNDSFLEDSGIKFSTFMFLQEIGIISGVESLGLTVTWDSIVKEKYLRFLVSNNKVIMLEHEDVNKKASAKIYQLTSIGKQVLALASFGSHDDYLVSIAKIYAKQGYIVKYADWKAISAGRGILSNERVIQA